MINSVEEWRDKGYRLRQPPLTFISYDPAGDGDDRDAIVLTNREEHQRGEPHDPDFAVERLYRVVQAHRLPQQLEFPDKVALMLRMHLELSQKAKSGLVYGHVFTVETNGVGYGMASTLRAKLGNKVIGYVTVGTSQKNDTKLDKLLAMPRLAALDNMRVLAETHHLKLSPNAPGGKELTAEMNSFVWRRPGRPEAMQGQHDDLVMALCGACWIGERVIPPTLKAKRYGPNRLN